MTNTEKIEKILNEIKAIWRDYPDLRLGQLILNAFTSDFYYVEDDEFIKRLKDFYTKKEEKMI